MSKTQTSAAKPYVFVRIKPFNPRKGIRTQRYTVFGLRFEESRGWYRLSRTIEGTMSGEDQKIDVVKFFSELRQSDDPESPFVFDVCEEEEAKAIQLAERKAKESKSAAVEEAVDMQTIDLSKPAKEAGNQRPLPPSGSGASAEEGRRRSRGGRSVASAE